MLDRLNDIPWQRLQHAYGSAEDVPELLRALGRSGKEDEALGELFGNIWHQGTVYEASPYTVPFLVELVAEPTVAHREEILGLIGALANGESYLAVHAQPGLTSGEFWRQQPDFEKRLEREQENVRRTRVAVLEHRDVICHLLKDATPMVRAGAAHVLSQFPEHVSNFGPLIRQAVSDESDPLALAAMLWCLGAIRDVSPNADALLDTAVRNHADPRQAFAAAIALYRTKGRPYVAALAIYRQMAAATWFAEGFLAGVPWDFSAEVELETLLAEFDPDPVGATRVLLTLLWKGDGQSDVFASIVHDLLQLNFAGGNWRDCTQLTTTQIEVLRQIVETDAAWRDVKRLWFLIPDSAKRLSELTPSEIHNARNDMRSVLCRYGV